MPAVEFVEPFCDGLPLPWVHMNDTTVEGVLGPFAKGFSSFWFIMPHGASQNRLKPGNPAAAERLAFEVSVNNATGMNTAASVADLCGAEPALRADTIVLGDGEEPRGEGGSAFIGRAIHEHPRN